MDVAIGKIVSPRPVAATAENEVTIYELDGVASDFITFNP